MYSRTPSIHPEFNRPPSPDHGLSALYRKSLLQEILLNCDPDDEMLACLKSIHMKNVIYWSTEAWQAIPESTLRKGSSKILKMEFIEDNHSKETSNLEKYFQKIPGCASVMEDVEKWVTEDDKVQELSDSDIDELVLSKEIEDTEGCNTHLETDPKVSYDKAFSALEKSLEFIENLALQLKNYSYYESGAILQPKKG
ncbi:hypothetical protein PGB90_009491 [Kerria lacca]